MKSSLFILAATLLALSLQAGSTPESERQQLLAHLNKSRQTFADAIRGLSPAQATFKTAPDRWSILEIAEHLIQAEQLLFDEAMKGLENPPGKKSQVTDREILEAWGTRKQKVKSSGDYDPTGRWPDLASVQNEFNQRRAKTIQFVTDTKEDLRAHLCCGGLDMYQQFLGTSAHVLRHVEQMNEVKADPGYPKQ
jgi:hypothetical protein